MTKSLKATLFSALVFPGLGHFYLKKWMRGLIFFGVACVALYYLSHQAFSRAMQITEKIQMGELPPDLATIKAYLTEQGLSMDTQTLSLVMIAFGMTWLLAMIDAYRIGRN